MGNSATKDNLLLKNNKKLYINTNLNYKYYLHAAIGINNKIHYTTSISGAAVSTDYKSKGFYFNLNENTNYLGKDTKNINIIFNKYKNYKNNDVTYNPNDKKLYYINYDLGQKNDSVILTEDGLKAITKGYRFYNIDYNNSYKNFISVSKSKVFFFNINNDKTISINKRCVLNKNFKNKGNEKYSIQSIASYGQTVFVSYRALKYNNEGKMISVDNRVNLYDLRNCDTSAKSATLEKTYKLGSDNDNFYIESIFFMNNKLYMGFTNNQFNKITFNEINLKNSATITASVQKDKGETYIYNQVKNNDHGIIQYSICKSKNAKNCKFINTGDGKKNIIRFTNIKFRRKITETGTYYVHLYDNFGNLITSNPVTVNQIGVKNFKLNDSEIQLKKGSQKKLGYTIEPSQVIDKTITWKSSDNNVVKVDSNGNVTATGNGIATITATTLNGKSDSVSISVISSEDLVLYKRITNFDRNDSVQNFIMINNTLYTTHKEAFLNKHNSNGTLSCASFGQKQGHMDAIDYEVSGGRIYLWTGCNAEQRNDDGLFATNICRMEFNPITFNDNGCSNVSTKNLTTNTILRGNHFAIDNSNNTIVIRTVLENSQLYRIYKLDDFIKNYNNEKYTPQRYPKATPILSFEILFNHLPDKVTRKNLFQNIEYENGYFYIYEGLSSTNAYDVGGYIQITKYKINLSGNCSGNACVEKIGKAKRIKYQYFDSQWWQETEGIRVIDKELYIGIAVKQRDSKRRLIGNFSYEIYKVNGMGTY